MDKITSDDKTSPVGTCCQPIKPGICGIQMEVASGVS